MIIVTETLGGGIPHLIINDAGVDYIPFLDLEVEDGVECQVVMPDRMGRVNGDYYSEPIYANTGIPIGGEGEQATELYVSYSITPWTSITIIWILLTQNLRNFIVTTYSA